MNTLTCLVATATLLTIVCAGCRTAPIESTAVAPTSSDSPKGDSTGMQVYYLEVVTKDVEAVCAAYAAANGVHFGAPDAGLGNARTAALRGGGLVGVRAPLRDTEEPIVRPYWLVQDIDAALAAAVKAGGQVAVPPLEIPGHGTFAIYVQGGVDHGLWKK